MTGQHRRPALFPAVFAAYPVLFLAPFSATQFELPELVLTLAAMMAWGAVVHALVLLVRRRWPGDMADALIATLIIAFLTCVPTIGEEVRRVLRPVLVVRWRLIYAVSVLLLGAGIWHLARRRQPPVLAGQLAGRVVYLLVAFSLARLGWEMHRQRAEARGPQFQHLVAPLPVRADAVARPDVYLIILDEYANGQVLAERLGIHNDAFEDSLRALGFVVPRGARSNYGTTSSSLASLLNLADLQQASTSLPRAQRDGYALRYMVEHNRLFQLFRSRGYVTWYAPSSDYPPTRNLVVADSAVLDPDEARRGAPSARLLLASGLWDAMLPGFVMRGLGVSVEGSEASLRTIDDVRRIPDLPGRPKLVFAHLMLTHLPFRVDADCRARRWVAWPAERFAAAYRAQVACTNRTLLDVVTRILARPGERPVIILQGDHGTATLLRRDVRVTAEGISADEMQERFGAFGAYYVPGGVPSITDGTSSLRAWRAIVTTWAGADLPPDSDRAYFSYPRRPMDFIRVR